MPRLRDCLLINCLALLAVPFAANAAGTYYTGAAYQSAQSRYGQTGTYATSGYGRAGTYATGYGANTGYSNYSQPYANSTYQNTNQVAVRQSAQPTQTTPQNNNAGKKNGFFVNGGLSHETGMWQFDMKTLGSLLHYDNVEWNVLDLNGGYVFDVGKTKMQVDAGFKYGMQWGESSMNDDDISNGGYEVAVEKKDGAVIGTRVGHAISVGTSEGGNMLGFNVGFGLTDFFKVGNVKITPSVGYRYLKYKLETKKNYGIMIDTINASGLCFGDGDETQCVPILTLYDYNPMMLEVNKDIIPRKQYTHHVDIGGTIYSYNFYTLEVPDNPQYLDTNGTTYYEQKGVSHSYETEWSGPYIALDMVYDINQYNSVNGRVELGFPGYTSTGDQPYRFDWQHPKSVQDSANMFSGFHLGLLANWNTAITDSVSLSLGVTYDYYTISGATAKTFLNGDYYAGVYEQRLIDWYGAGYTENTEDYMLYGVTEEDRPGNNPLNENDEIVIGPDATALRILKTANDCSGWVCEASNEINSIYKSMGVRVGINARF